MPNVSLASYFQANDIDFFIDWAETKETHVDKIFAAYEQLSAEQQSAVEADFQDIHALASEGGVQALVDESHFYNDDAFAEEVAAIDGFHAKVMWTFLNKPTYWRGANMFLHADNVASSYWKRRNDLPDAEPNVEDEDIDLLAKKLSQYFYKQQGRGRNCKVEPYRRYNKEYFFAYPEDYAQTDVEWESNQLTTRPRHPAFEVIFVYSQYEHALDIYAPKNSKAIEDLQRIFVESILKLNTLPDGTLDKRVYELKPIADKGFEFQIEPEAGIAEIVVTKLRLRLLQGDNRRITLEANTQNNTNEVYDLLADLNLPEYKVIQVGLKAVYEVEIGTRVRSKPFSISYPNNCSLGHEGNDLLIRNILRASGIEPALDI